MPDETLNIAIVILAAGASKRMGRPKQLLKWGSESLVSHAISKALELGSPEVILVLGANHEAFESEINHFPITILKNENWEEGLGKSIACAANYVLKSKLKTSSLLITLADQPLIDTDFLNGIIQKFSQNQNQIVSTSYEKGKKGVPVLFDACYLGELSNLSVDNGAKRLLKKHQSYINSLQFRHKNLDIRLIINS